MTVNLGTAMFRRGAKWKRHHLLDAAAQKADVMEFRVQDHMIDKVDTFKCLIFLLSFYNSDWPAVDGKCWKVRRKWGMFSQMIVHEGAYPHMSGRFYVTVVQYVLMFFSEMWVLMPCILMVMGSLHHL